MARAEHQAGFDRYQRCLAEQCYQLDFMDRSRLVVDYAVPDSAVDAGADQTCYLRHSKVLDIAWQGAHAEDSTVDRRRG